MQKWPRHWDRVLRWERRVHGYKVAPPEGEASTIGRDEEELGDFLYAAFVTVYHLKDHLLKDPQSETRAKGADLEGYISASTPLSYCADMANAFKHLIIGAPGRPRPRRSADLLLIPTVILSCLPAKGDVTIVEQTFSMQVGTSRVDPKSVLLDAVLDWEYFLVEEAEVMVEDWRTLNEKDHYSYLPPRRPPSTE